MADRPQASTAERLLDEAQQLIQQKGYNGFSYEDLSRAVGLRKPSIHHHFPHKEDLGARVIQRYSERFEASLAQIDRSHQSAIGRLQAYMALFQATYGSSRLLCPGGMLGAEAAGLPPKVLDSVNAFFKLNLTWLASLLELGRATNNLAFGGSTSAQALFVLCALEGAMVVGRGLGRQDAVDQAVGMVLRQVAPQNR